jgi:hypothetical protein
LQVGLGRLKMDGMNTKPIYAEMRPPARRSWWMALVRWLVSLALCLWIGGLAFFGIFAAPAMFRVARAAGEGSLAPQMVSAMLARFGVVLIVCAVVLVLGWGVERREVYFGQARERLWWWAQGAASALMMGVALYLHLALMPRIQALQSSVLGEGSEQSRAVFDVAHRAYGSLASLSLYAGLLVLLAQARRSTR